MAVKKFSTAVKVGLEEKSIRHVVSIPTHNLIVVSCAHDSEIRVFADDIAGNLLHIYAEHSSTDTPNQNVDFLHLFGDVICSASGDGYIRTWNAISGAHLGIRKVQGYLMRSMVKLNNTQVALVSDKNQISILKHSRGRNIELERTITVRDIDEISNIDGYRDTVAAVGENGKCEIWNSATGGRTFLFEVANKTDLVKISSKYIVFGNRKAGFIQIHKNNVVCEYMRGVALKSLFEGFNPSINDITLINDLVMLSCSRGIVFKSLPSYEFSHIFEGENNCATVLQDGRICAAGKRGDFGTFKVPKNIRYDLILFALEMYRESVSAPASSSQRGPFKKEDEEVGSIRRKRSREDYEQGIESADVAELIDTVTELEDELESQKTSILEEFKSHKTSMMAEMKKMEDNFKAKLDDQKKKMEDSFKVELDDQKKKMISMKLEVDDQEEEILEMKLKLAEERENMKKELKAQNLDRQREKGEMKKLKEELNLLKAALAKTH